MRKISTRGATSVVAEMCTFNTFFCSSVFSAFKIIWTRAAVVHLSFRTRLTFPVQVFTVLSSMDRTSRCNKVDAVRLSFAMHLFLVPSLNLFFSMAIFLYHHLIVFSPFLQIHGSSLSIYFIVSIPLGPRKTNWD